MASNKPVIHGRDHRPVGFYGPDDPGGADPIPTQDTTVYLPVAAIKADEKVLPAFFGTGADPGAPTTLLPCDTYSSATNLDVFTVDPANGLISWDQSGVYLFYAAAYWGDELADVAPVPHWITVLGNDLLFDGSADGGPTSPASWWGGFSTTAFPRETAMTGYCVSPDASSVQFSYGCEQDLEIAHAMMSVVRIGNLDPAYQFGSWITPS